MRHYKYSHGEERRCIPHRGLLLHLCLCMCFLLFCLSILLVRGRQKLLLNGRKISDLEKSLADLSIKNHQLETEIIRLNSKSSLSSLVASDRFVRISQHDVEKVTRTQMDFFAVTRSQYKSGTKFAAHGHRSPIAMMKMEREQ